MRWATERSARYETKGSSPGSSKGTTVTASATANTKGSWTDIGTATSFPYEMLIVCMVSAAAQVGDYCVDIGINASGNRLVIAPDLRMCCNRVARGGGVMYQLPLHVPGGKQLSARCAGDSSSLAAEVVLIGVSRGVRGCPGYGRMISLYTPSNSRGVDIDPSTANTDSSWTELASSTSIQVAELMIHIGNGGLSGKADNRWYLLDLALGGAGSERSLIDDLFLGQENNDDHPRWHYSGALPCDIPAGSRLSARIRTDVINVSQDQIDLAAWGFL